MKVIKANELVKIVAGKLDLEFQADNFADFKEFVSEIYTQFVTRWESLDDQAYYWHNVNVPERIVKIPTKVLQAVYEDANARFKIADNDGEFYDEESDDYEMYDNPFDVKGAITTINYVDQWETSIEEFLNYWHDVCKRFACEITVLAGTDDDCAYGNHMLEWKINTQAIKSVDSFFEIPDDSSVELMDALFWLCENFHQDTFEGFEKLGVELRYYEKETDVE
jgi:hypothetical protein